ncbi:TPA: methyltransferase domain-containing protein [Acinetobacter baumannii]|nr:methyltransferase domain-containing protein [Acinetobacter baumannii]KAB1609203.1 class I SAM-dependent methyltransferase [Acinetobacter baumannii]HAV5392933.1 methyltransferase domain-containing protein [Acinetobacter baumannii]
MKYKKICEGVFQVDEKGAPIVEIEGKEHFRLMDFFYIAVPADELNSEQVSKLCQARVYEKRCFEGANKSIKKLFNRFILKHSSISVLEVGAGNNPVLTRVEAEASGITYITSDADDVYQDISFHFDADTDLPSKSVFDIVISLFVLHFKFYQHQINQIFKHIKEDGVFLANVYNRTDDSRKALEAAFKEEGFQVELFKDPKNSCREHYYLMASKDIEIISKNKEILLCLIESDLE